MEIEGLTPEIMRDILWEDGYGYNDNDPGAPPVFEKVEQTEWIHSHKCQECVVIFSYQGKFYEFIVTRSGDDFTDWVYDDLDPREVMEVEKREVVTTEWVRVLK